MAVGLGAAGVVGIAREVTQGTYVAPAKFFPVRSESLQWQQGTNWRSVIRGTVDPIGAVAGDGHVEGDIDMELLHDVAPWFLGVARADNTKTGTTDLVYEFVGSHGATPADTLSITVVRNGVVFAYTGCCVGSQSYTTDNAQAVATYGLVGRAEATQSAPTETYTDDGPFGAGTYTIEVPTAAQVFDIDQFNLQINDNATPQMRLQDSLGARFISYGERETTLSVDRDFENKTEYGQFKALTSKSVTIHIESSATRYVEFIVPAAIIDTYDVAIGNVGELVRASVAYRGVHDATLESSYQINVGTDESLAWIT
jgi:Phage tail tube protein